MAWSKCNILVVVILVSLILLRIPLSMDTPTINVHVICPSPTLSEGNLPLTALASFPGSGNTWFRHLLQQMTGVLTGSIYSDVVLKNDGFHGEGRQDGRVIAIKTHVLYRARKDRYQRAILLVRNPFEAFLSDFTRRASHSHTGRVNLFDFTEWRTFLKTNIAFYHNFHISWMEHTHILVIWYDKLKSNLRGELARTKVFLDDENISGNIECALVGSEGNFHRNESGIPLDFFYHLNDRVQINRVIDEMYEIFRRRFRKVHDHMLKWKLHEHED